MTRDFRPNYVRFCPSFRGEEPKRLNSVRFCPSLLSDIINKSKIIDYKSYTFNSTYYVHTFRGGRFIPVFTPFWEGVGGYRWTELIDPLNVTSESRPGRAQVLSGRESQDRLITYQKARAILSGKIGAPAVSCATSVTAKRQDKGTPKPQLISNKQVTYCQVTLEY